MRGGKKEEREGEEEKEGRLGGKKGGKGGERKKASKEGKEDGEREEGREGRKKAVLSPGEGSIHWSPYRVIKSFHCNECCCLGINIRSVETSLMKMTFGGLCFCCICIKSFAQLDTCKLKM